MAGSLTAAARELARYTRKLDLVGSAGGSVGQRGHGKSRDYNFF